MTGRQSCSRGPSEVLSSSRRRSSRDSRLIVRPPSVMFHVNQRPLGVADIGRIPAQAVSHDSASVASMVPVGCLAARLGWPTHLSEAPQAPNPGGDLGLRKDQRTLMLQPSTLELVSTQLGTTLPDARDALQPSPAIRSIPGARTPRPRSIPLGAGSVGGLRLQGSTPR
jgi:hypothetical protein